MCICIYIFVDLQATTIRFDVAHLCHLTNLEDKEQRELLDCILGQLDSDELWDEEDMFEKAYKQMGYKRYRLNKQMLETQSKETKDTENIIGGKDMGKKATTGMLENEKAPDAAKVEIKLEHEFIRPASDQLTTLNAKYKRMQAYIQEYKSLSAMLHLKGDCKEKDEHGEQITKGLQIWDKLESEVLMNRVQLTSVNVQKMHKDKCKTLVDNAADLNTRVQTAIDAATGAKKRLNQWMHDPKNDTEG